MTEEERKEVVNRDYSTPVGWTSFMCTDDSSTRVVSTLFNQFNSDYPDREWSKPESEHLVAVSQCDWYQDLENYYRHGEVPEDWIKTQHTRFKRIAHHFRWEGTPYKGRLLYQVGSHWVICITPEEVAPILQKVHDEGGHFSFKIILDKLRYRVFWPTMASDVRKYIQECIQCARFCNRGKSEPLYLIIIMKPFCFLGMDHMGPFSETFKGNIYILVLIDYFSRFVITFAVPDTLATTTTQCLQEVFNKFFHPIALWADLGSSFWNQEVHDFLTQLGISITHVASGSHKSVGIMERTNLILQRCLLRSGPVEFTEDGTEFDEADGEWDERLLPGTRWTNQRHMAHLGYSSIEIIFGVTPGELMDLEDTYPTEERTSLIQMFNSEEFDIIDQEEDLAALILNFMGWRHHRWDRVQEANVGEKHRMKWEHQAGSSRRQLKTGDLVMLYDDLGRRKGKSKWRGPFLILGKGGEHGKTFSLGFTHAGLDQDPMRRGVRVHGDRLRRFVPREGYLIPTSEAKLPVYRKMRFRRTNLPPGQFQKELEAMEERLKERLANESDGQRQRRLDSTMQRPGDDSEIWEDLEEEGTHAEAREVLERLHEGETDDQFKERLERTHEYAQECFSRMTHKEWQNWGEKRARKEDNRTTQVSLKDVKQ